MTDLSFKYRKKAIRDIYLSSDIGRDSPFDPFKDRTVSKFMQRPDTYLGDGMYYAEKKGRRVPCMVNYSHIPHQANVRIDKLVEEGGIPATRKEDEALMDKGYVRPNYIRDVSFTKAQRFDNEAPKNHVQLRKKLLEEREETIRQEKFRSSSRHDNVTMPDIVQVPDCSRAPTFGVPPPKEDYSLLKGRSKFTTFPFENKSRTAERSESAPLYPPQSDDVSGGDQRGHSSLGEETQPRILTSAADAQEVWESKRKETLSKHGLITGNRKELLRAKAKAKRADTAQGIADFSLLASREAPTAFQPRCKEPNDLLYLPKYEVTTRDPKRLADVRIGKYAQRTTNSTVLKDTVDKILTIENLSRFYKHQIEKERHSAFVTPDHQSQDRNDGPPQPSASINTSSASTLRLGPGGTIVDDSALKPFSPFDDYALHPPTPPKVTMTRKFTKTPDLANFADRANEPMSAILGGDRQKREKAARQALRREGLL